MVIDDIIKTARFEMIPINDNEAIDRLTEFGALGLQGLYKCVFKDIEQLQRAFYQVHYIAKFKPIMFSSGKQFTPEVTQIITYKGELSTADGTVYEMIVNEVPGKLEILNARLVKEGYLRTPSEWKAIKETMEPDKKEI